MNTDEIKKIKTKKGQLLDEYGRPILRTNNKILASGYSNAAASLTKPIFKGWEYRGGSADDDIVANVQIMRERCRMVAMEDPVFSGTIDTLCDYTIGTGLVPQAVPDEDYLREAGISDSVINKFKSDSSRFWDVYAEYPHCDVYHRDNLYELMRLACRSADDSGDVFVTTPRFSHGNYDLFDLKIQVIEADCCADPDSIDKLEAEINGHDIYGGVEIDQWGRVRGYWFYTGHPLSRRQHTFNHYGQKYPRWIFIPAFGPETGEPMALHIMESKRPGQRRGIPIFAPSLEMALMISQYMRAETIAARIQALFTLVITSENPDATAGEMTGMEGEYGQSLTDGDESLIALGNGIVQYARPGEKIESVNPSRPTSSFAPFMETGYMAIGASILPYEKMMKRYGQSFSASKAANNDAKVKIKIRRGNFVGDFCQPVRSALITECAMKGFIEVPGFFENRMLRNAWLRCKWSGIGMPQIDENDFVKGAKEMIALGLSTATEQSSELNGSDFFENLAVRSREIKAAVDAGLSKGAAQGLTSAMANITDDNTGQADQANANQAGGNQGG